MENEKQKVGRKGEEQACRYLSDRGHIIIERNFRSAHLEVDIISLKGSELHIVEVKSRTAPSQAPPQANVNRTKQQRLVRAANAFLHSTHRKPLPDDLEVVFDVVSVIFEGNAARIQFFPDAYRPIFV